MQRQQTQGLPAPAPRRPAPTRAALRRLTPAELRVAAGGLVSRKAGKGQLEYL
jgi:hypothetical protein